MCCVRSLWVITQHFTEREPPSSSTSPVTSTKTTEHDWMWNRARWWRRWWEEEKEREIGTMADVKCKKLFFNKHTYGSAVVCVCDGGSYTHTMHIAYYVCTCVWATGVYILQYLFIACCVWLRYAVVCTHICVFVCGCATYTSSRGILTHCGIRATALIQRQFGIGLHVDSYAESILWPYWHDNLIYIYICTSFELSLPWAPWEG